MTEVERLSLRIKKLMLEKDISRIELQEKSNISKYTLDRILSCKYKSVNFIIIFKLSIGFDMSIQEFLDDELFEPKYYVSQ